MIGQDCRDREVKKGWTGKPLPGLDLALLPEPRAFCDGTLLFAFPVCQNPQHINTAHVAVEVR